MRTADVSIKLLMKLEADKGPALKPYLCPAGVPTIGYGNTFYPNGRKVTMHDPPITPAYAVEMLLFVVSLFEKDVSFLLKRVVRQCQFDALVLFAYNVGSDIDQDDIPEGLGDSTLLKLINRNPDDPAIRAEFIKWNKAGGKVLNGLTIRRQLEADLYFSYLKQK